MAKVFISSTSKDLEAYREVANEECNRLGLVPIDMKYFPAMGKGATEGSKRKLDEADLYVGILAHRYGYIEDGFDKSVTEIEFDYAGNERRLDRLCFLVDPNHAWSESGRDRKNQERLQAFKNKIDESVIRALFTSAEDFRGKLRLALMEWKLGAPEGGTLQPPLSLNLLKPTAANRLTYRARQTPFVGREREMTVLNAFLASEADFLWLVVGGPAGSGKSRLVQELCVRAGAHWRAGFALSGQGFYNWASWRPSADTLIVIDYAAERVDEIKALLHGLVLRQSEKSRHAAVRVLLVERETDGPWLKESMGSRSESYAIEQARFADSPLVLGPMDEEDLWEAIRNIHGAASVPLPARAQVMGHLRELDPLERPLYAILAADALISGRDIGDWDRERLMRDVLERERQGWAKMGVTEPYENLLALATMIGGLTEEVLKDPPQSITLPSFKEFERSLYSVMTGCDLEGESLPPLKPDLVGEFFVLAHVKGRNERVTAEQAAEFCSAVWRIRGGSTRRDYFGVPGITHLVPSSLVLFLRRLIDDFSDHPAARHFLSRPREPGTDLWYWADLTVTGIRRYLASGDFDNAKSLFEELSALSLRELHDLHAESELIKAAFGLLPYAVGDDCQTDRQPLLDRIRELAFAEFASPDVRLAFCEGAADAMKLLLAKGEKELVQELLEEQHRLVRAHPAQAELRLHYSSGLGLIVCSEGALEIREQAFERLKAFCGEFRDDLMLYIALAQAARLLCEEYVLADRLMDAERMNQTIRGLVRLRSEKRLMRYSRTFEEEDFNFGAEEVWADLVAMELDLAETDVWLMGPFMRAQRYREANQLLEEINRLWQGKHLHDPRFARWWGWAVMKHADACAQEGHFEQIGKALDALHELSGKFPGDAEFAGYASMLALNGLKRATDAGEFSIAEEMLDTLKGFAQLSAEQEPTVNYAEGAMALCIAYQEHGQMEQSIEAPRAAAWALRSEAYRQRCIQRGGEESMEALLNWLDALGAMNEQPSSDSR